MTPTSQQCGLPNGEIVTVLANWRYCRGTPGTLSDAPGWELIEFVVVDHPRLSLNERAHIHSQLSHPDHRP